MTPDVGLEPGSRRPRLVLLCGLAGAGKTTHARDLERQGWRRFSIDAETWRRGQAGTPTSEADVEDVVARQRVEISVALADGKHVVVDYAFATRSERDVYRELGRRHGATVEVVHLDTPVPVIRRRLAARANRHADDVVVDPETLESYLATFEPPGPDEPDVTVVRPPSVDP